MATLPDPHEGPEPEPQEEEEEQATYDNLLKEEVINTCRCGDCCRQLIIETCLEDALREPLIKERGSPIKGFTGELLTAA